MERPLVSVLITIYNAEAQLASTLRALQAQTYSPFEIICVEDGSTDESLKILREFAVQDFRIKIFTPGRLGRAKALNFGIERANGEFLAINDADDLSTPDRLEKQIAFFLAHPEVGMLGSQYEIFETETGLLRTIDLPLDNHSLRQALTQGQPFHHSSIMFRMPVLQKLKGYDIGRKFLLDREIFIRAAAICEIANLKERLLRVTHHGKRYFFYGFTSRTRELHHNWLRMKAIWSLNFPFTMLAKPLFAMGIALVPHSLRLSLPSFIRTRARQLIYPEPSQTTQIKEVTNGQ